MQQRFQSTRPVKGATSAQSRRRFRESIVSIHAPREGRDGVPGSIRTGRQWFQSTRPVKGATATTTATPRTLRVSIHAPREGRDVAAAEAGDDVDGVSIHAPREGRDTMSAVSIQPVTSVSIHAPREGRDWHHNRSSTCRPMFQSTRPVKGATFICLHPIANCRVSIHAPREGRDTGLIFSVSVQNRFNPRAP